MRRSERITAWAGAALIAATTLAATVALVDHGMRPVTAPVRSEVLPADLSWAL